MLHRGTAALLLTLVVYPRGIAAQPAMHGQLSGTVRDATTGVIGGAVVRVHSPQLIGGILETTSGRDGQWRASALPPGTYDVTVTHLGFETARLGPLLVSPGLTLGVDVRLELAGIAATQEAPAAFPLVNVSSAAVVTNVSTRLLQDLPTSRTISDLLNLVPGVAGEVAYGGSKQSNGIYFDGVDATEPAEQGPWLRFNQNWLQELQVVGLGADAEHGKSTGVNAYAIVRSGGNRYSGLAEYWTTRPTWVGNNTRRLSEQLQRSFASRRIDTYWDASGQVGGPINRDRIWFFAGLSHTSYNHAPAGYDGPISQEEDDTQSIGKLTAAISNHWRTEGFVQGGRRQVLHQGIGRLTAPEATTIRRKPQASWSTRAIGQIGGLLLDLRYAGYVSPVTTEALTSEPAHFDLLTGIRSVNALTTDRSDVIRHRTEAGGTWHSRTSAGDHEVKFGIQSGWGGERSTFEYGGGQIYWDQGSTPFLRDTFTGSVAVGNTRDLGLFVQDRWRVHRRITILPGFRIDLFRGSTSDASGVLQTDPASGRIGVAWDMTGSGRSVIRAHFGRYTDPVLGQPVLLTDFANPGVTISEALNASGQWEEVSRRSFAGSRRIDPNLKHAYGDQVIVGIERQLLRNVTLQAQYIHRSFERFMGFVYDNALWEPVERRDPGPDGVEGSLDDGSVVTVYDLRNASSVIATYTNPEDAFRRYDAWQIVGTRRYAGDLEFQASYTWSRSSGTIANGFHANSARGGDLGQGNAGNPNRLINSGGRLPHDPTHEAKLVASWQPKWLRGANVGTVYRYMSGAAWARTFGAFQLTQGIESILAEPRGSRRVDAINNLDLRVEGRLTFANGRRVSLNADIFNVTNQGVPDSDWGAPVITASGSSLGLPTLWREPRTLRVAVRLMY